MYYKVCIPAIAFQGPFRNGQEFRFISIFLLSDIKLFEESYLSLFMIKIGLLIVIAEIDTWVGAKVMATIFFFLKTPVRLENVTYTDEKTRC